MITLTSDIPDDAASVILPGTACKAVCDTGLYSSSVVKMYPLQPLDIGRQKDVETSSIISRVSRGILAYRMKTDSIGTGKPCSPARDVMIGNR